MELASVNHSFLLYEFISDYPTYKRMLSRCIADAIPEGLSLILADDASISLDAVGSRRCLPFLESGGVFNGQPANDEGAILEVERMRAAGASFIAIARPAFWWLNYYAGFRQHLCERFPCLAYRPNSGHIICIIFDLRQPRPQSVAAPWRMVPANRITYLRALVPEKQLKQSFASALKLIDSKIGPEGIGDYFEFGVYGGASISIMCSVLEELGHHHVSSTLR